MKWEFYNELLSRDSNGRVRVVYLSGKWDIKTSSFSINKQTGLLTGKLTSQPEKVITEGKANRTPYEQGVQEYKSLLKKYLDKGYKDVKTEIGKKISQLDDEDINTFLPNNKTDANGVLKPMLAKSYKDIATKAFEKEYYASKKIDGVRALLYRVDNEDGTFEVHSASRGGKDYDISLHHILTDPFIIKIFTKYPDIILDGEVYRHGWTLQRISGTARLEKMDEESIERMRQLQYWIYDIVDVNKKFIDRLEILLAIKPLIDKSENLVFVEHTPISGWLNIKKKHDQFVKEGFEGVVIRRVDAKYGPGKRTTDMIKLKEYSELEGIIVGWEPGLRPVEDMVFVMELPSNGKRFKAKPMGDRATKEEYVKNMESLIGQQGTVSYFYLSEDGVPLQPTFKHVRPIDE